MAVSCVLHTLLPERVANAYKGVCGRVGIVAGSVGMPGAAILATKAAFRAGAGLVYLASPPEVLLANLCHTPETIGIPLVGDKAEWIVSLCDAVVRQKWDVCIVGPGLGLDHPILTEKGCLHFFKVLRAYGVCCVVDADALTPHILDLVADGQGIFTPHEGEFVRVFGSFLDRTVATCDAAKRTGQTWVLKGPQTVIATQKGYSVNTTGNPGMAVAGSGDVLSGIIGGLWAQYAPQLRLDCAWQAAAIGVWLHGKAGDIAYLSYGVGLLPSDVLDNIGQAYRQITQDTVIFLNE